jgi:hypothetical protein
MRQLLSLRITGRNARYDDIASEEVIDRPYFITALVP